MPDHVHMLVDVDPQFGVHTLIKTIKGKTSRILRMARLNFVVTVGKKLGKLKKQKAIIKLDNKEQRWMKDQDHKISCQLVNFAKKTMCQLFD